MYIYAVMIVTHPLYYIMQLLGCIQELLQLRFQILDQAAPSNLYCKKLVCNRGIEDKK